MMNQKERNLNLFMEGMKDKRLQYTVAGDTIKMVVSGESDHDSGKGKALTYICMEMQAASDGMMMTARMPFRMRLADQQEEDLLLRVILDENYGTIRGGAVFDRDSRMLMYKTFVAINEEATGFKDDELILDMEVTRSGLADAYQAFLAKKSERDNPAEQSDGQGEGASELRQRMSALLGEEDGGGQS
ncbi:MAG: hypothetical protein IJE08_01360 [Clostridia bacterium]|nr:hypothetical protein [Clostridia bacterium]